MSPAATVRSREATHGAFVETAAIAQKLKAFVADELRKERPGQVLDGLTFVQREALDMILAKIARIIAGDPDHPDHWRDIAGYALLALGGPDPADLDAGIVRQSIAVREAPAVRR